MIQSFFPSGTLRVLDLSVCLLEYLEITGDYRFRISADYQGQPSVVNDEAQWLNDYHDTGTTDAVTG